LISVPLDLVPSVQPVIDQLKGNPEIEIESSAN
jgi:hypothetical protein